MKKLYAILLAISLFMTAVPVGAQEQPSSVDTITEKADVLTQKYGATSMQYAFIEDGQITQSGHSGVYSKTENRALTDDVMYGVGSVSKVYTAAAAMKLVEEGKLNLDEPVVTYLPEFTMQDERYKQITPRMLLNHSSGLYGSTLTNGFLFADSDSQAHDDFLNRLSGQVLKADPGAFSVYCNDGFTLLELVIEKVSGQSLTQYLTEQFFQPLQLVHTKTPQDSFDQNQLAKVYSPYYFDALPVDSVNLIGTGGIYSTAIELCLFSEVLSGNKPELLSAESAAQMQSAEYQKGIWPDTDQNTVGFGLGWDSVDLYPFSEYGIKALSKGGDTLLYHSSLIVLPEEDMAVAVLSSGGSSSLNSLFATDLLLSALKEKGRISEIKPPKTFTPPVPAEMPAELEAYSGIYGATGGISEVIVKDGELRIPAPEGSGVPDQSYLYTEDGTFQSSDGSIRLFFVEEENGNIYLQLEGYAALPEFYPTVSTTYNAQKLPAAPVEEPVLSAWQERQGKTYYYLNEKSTSQVYFPTIPSITIEPDYETGYVLGCRIVDENHAVNAVQIPITGGRDSMDLVFTNQDGIEYLHLRGGILVSEDAVSSIFDGSESICTIQENGYARWYTIGQSSAGRTMTVEVPPDSSFAVYDANGICVNFTTVSGNHSTVLPQGGSIAFIGPAGSRFSISLPYAEH